MSNQHVVFPVNLQGGKSPFLLHIIIINNNIMIILNLWDKFSLCSTSCLQTHDSLPVSSSWALEFECWHYRHEPISSTIFIFLCVCASVHLLWGWGHICMYMFMWRFEVDGGVFLDHSSPYLLRQDFSVEPRAHQYSLLGGGAGWGVSYLFPPNTGIAGWPLWPPSIYLGSRDPNTHTWTTSNLSTQSPPGSCKTS